MRLVISLAIVAVLLLASSCSSPASGASLPDVRDNHVTHTTAHDLVQRINAANTTWTATEYWEDNARVVPAVKRLLKPSYNVTLPFKTYNDSVEVPESFDARDHWPNCPSLRRIRDQSNCGSCWAHSTSSMIEDRICIATGGRFTAPISAQDLLSCCTGRCGRGCYGGEPEEVMRYYVSNGIVTGGGYNSSSGCLPYVVPNGHHGEPYFNQSMPTCSKSCVNGAPYLADKHKGREAYALATVRDMQRDIMEHGPIVTEYAVYADFSQYKSGVYQKMDDEYVVLHDVRVLGWGVDQGVDYWLVANSWNTTWGEDGFFRIRRGVNECRFEEYVVAAIPDEE